MFCRYCGNELNDDDNFCNNCGKPVNDDEQQGYDIDISSFGNDRISAAKYVAHTYNISLSEAKKIVDSKYNQQSIISSNNKATNKSFCCPKCKGNNIDLIATDKNMNIKRTTSYNMNPFHPFTKYNHNEKITEKKSAAKIALGSITMGTSLLVTGTKNKKHCEYFCRDCGHRWIGK